jgi:hypothetical protein
MNLITVIRNLFVVPANIKVSKYILIVAKEQDCKLILLNSGFEFSELIQKRSDHLLFSALVEKDTGYLVIDSEDKIDLQEFIYEHFAFEYERKYSKYLFGLVQFEAGDVIYLLRGGNKHELELYKKD